ncbi:MAG: thioredoxin-disulfide reductase [Candidatus Brockarchaeota archaeon]|nr:thioredoxin-disulfide reductase [Candidatus Brockarchaeota archaeon]MBO3808855.1 thioredoxin-disulfide reductase [Candidatus Brockarchaeota archaeon]
MSSLPLVLGSKPAGETYDVIIIGSGPAGLTAAIYTGRARLKTLVIAGSSWGGQLMLTSLVENYPGFPEGLLGPDLMNNMLKQAQRFGAEMIFEDAESADFSGRPFKVVAGGVAYKSHAVIIATGASPKELGVKGEERLRGKGVSNCAVCDGAFFRDRTVVVVGGGDSAMEEALFLTKFAEKVKVIHRRSELRATKILQERAFSNPKIEFVWNSVVEEILGGERVEGVRVKRVDTGEVSEIRCDGVFVSIGYKPNTELFRGQVEMDEKGYIVVRDYTKTSVDGVFVAGEAKDYRYRQAITAAGEGCQAALDAIKYVEEIKHRPNRVS